MISLCVALFPFPGDCIYDQAESLQAAFDKGHIIGSHTWYVQINLLISLPIPFSDVLPVSLPFTSLNLQVTSGYRIDERSSTQRRIDRD